MFFEIDSSALGMALILLLLAFLLRRWGSSFPKPHLRFPLLDVLKTTENTRPSPFHTLPRLLELASFTLFLIAFIDPHFLIAKKNVHGEAPPKEGIAIYLLVDRSGSMKEEVTAILPSGQLITESKEVLVKQMTTRFVEGDASIGLGGRSNDLIGLIEFARTAQIVSPLTFNHTYLLQQLSKLHVVTDQSENGTAIGYAIFKAANLIAVTRRYAQEELPGAEKAAYDIKSAIIILLTDGFQQPHPEDRGNRLRNMDLEEAAQYAKEQGVKIYIINVDPAVASEEYAPQRKQMEEITRMTNGNFFLINQLSSLATVYAKLDQLEKSKIPDEGQSGAIALPRDKQPDRFRRISLYPWLIAMGMIALFTSILLETLVYRRIP